MKKRKRKTQCIWTSSGIQCTYFWAYILLFIKGFFRKWAICVTHFFFFDEKLVNFIHKLGQISIDSTSYISWSVIFGGESSTHITISRIDLASLAIKCVAVLLLHLVCEIFQLSNFLSHHEMPLVTFWIEIAGVILPLRA